MAAGKSEDFGKLLLRIALGLILLFHGYFKLVHGVEWIRGPLGEHGLPGFLAYGAYLGEIVAPLMVLLGYRTRIAAPVIAIDMLAAIFLVMQSQMTHIREAGGGWGIELEMILLLGSLALFFLGGGKYGVTGGKHAWD